MSQIQKGKEESDDEVSIVEKLQWLRGLINWSNLHGIGNSRIVTLTVFTPFIGYAIIYHSEAAKILGNLGGLLETFGNDQTCLPAMDFQTRLSFFYIGLLLVGIGSILFKIFAPIEVKGHGNQVEYAEKQLHYLTTRNFRSMFWEIERKRPIVAEKILEKNQQWLFGYDTSFGLTGESAKNREGQIDIVRSYFTTKSRYTNRVAAYITTLVYVWGGVILIVPSIEFTYRVVCKTIE